MTKFTLTPTEVGQLLGLGRNSTYDAIRRGQIRSVRIGKKILIPRAEIDRLLGSTSWQNEVHSQAGDQCAAPTAAPKSNT